MGKQIPIRKGNFFLGIALELIKDPLKFLSSATKEFPEIVTYRFATRQVVYLSDPALVKHVLQTNSKNYQKGLQYEPLKLVLGNGLLTSEGDFWLRQRRIIAPVFHKKYIDSFAEQMVSSTRHLIKEWDSQKGKVIDAYPSMMQLTLDIVGLTLLSTNVKDKATSVGHALGVLMEFAINRVRAIIKLPLWFPRPSNIKFRKKKKVLDDLVLDIIKRRRTQKSDHIDLLDMLMKAQDEETGETMTDEQLKDEVMTIFIAGHETTACALSFTLYLLAENPDKQELLYREVSSVLGENEPTLEDLRKLEFTTQVIYESMRLYPPAWIISRRSLGSDQLGEYSLPEESNMLICAYAMHRDERRWENANEFNPDRFEKEKMKDVDKFGYLPFGGGPRICIGNNFALMEMQIAVSMMVQKFKFEKEPSFNLELDPLVTLRPKNGVNLKLIKRS